MVRFAERFNLQHAVAFGVCLLAIWTSSPPWLSASMPHLSWLLPLLLLCLLGLAVWWCWPPYDCAAKLRVAGRLTTSASDDDRSRGVQLYLRIVAEHGPVLEACLNLAACHEHGLGVEESLSTACAWYESAALQDHASAQTRLAHYLFGAASASGSGATLASEGGKPDVKRAMALWEAAAAQGDVEAMDQVGHRYIEGAEVAGVTQDLKRTERWWGRAVRRPATPTADLPQLGVGPRGLRRTPVGPREGAGSAVGR